MKWVTLLSHVHCDPMNCSLPGSSVHGIFQARVLECIAFAFSRGSSQPRDWTWVFCIAVRDFTIWATRKSVSYSCILGNLELNILTVSKGSKSKLGIKNSKLTKSLNLNWFCDHNMVPGTSPGWSRVFEAGTASATYLFKYFIKDIKSNRMRIAQ